MRCLYCGKELALLKRLRGGGEFCSEAHKQRYQEEYDRIALSRLLQAQKKVQPVSASPVESPPATQALVAVEEPTIDAPLDDQLVTPQKTAGFVVSQPEAAGAADEVPYLESWVEGAEAPVAPEWNFESTRTDILPAGLLPVTGLPKRCDQDSTIPEAKWIFELLSPGRQDPRIPASPARAGFWPRAIDKPAVIEVPVRMWGVNLETTRTLKFEAAIEFGESALLETLPASVEFSAEDSEAIVPVSCTAGSVSDTSTMVLPPEQPDLNIPRERKETVVGAQSPAQHLDADQQSSVSSPGQALSSASIGGEKPAMPHDTLEALSRMHQRMHSDEGAENPTAAVEVVTVQVAVTPDEQPAASQEPVPAKANDLIEIPIKIVAPAKRGVAGVSALTATIAPLLPRLKALPLRPKFGRATPDLVEQTKAVQQPTAARVSESKAAQVLAPKPSGSPLKPTPVGKAEKPAPKDKADQVKPALASKPVQPASATPVAASTKEAPASNSVGIADTSRPRDAKKVMAAAEPSQPLDPAAESARSKPSPPVLAPASERKSPLVPDERLPSFGSIGRSNTTPWGSLKIKIIAAAVIITGGIAYFGWGSRSHHPTVLKTAVSSDGAGPSVIIGEGGWVVGWGADASGSHSEREITIYRPSLKLSDYRIEFQGDIESKSMGWVFRASDPENYYAMKISLVSTGLSPKVALFKYIVVKGRPTQVGRVPMEIEARNDTVFKVRVDVLGPKFSTFIQGQPVDVWTDDQLKSGGVGFLNERGERGRIKSVSIRYLNGDNQ